MIAPITVFHLLQACRRVPTESRHRHLYPLDPACSDPYPFLLIPIWLLLAMEPHYLPEASKFIGPKEKTSIPLYLQFLFAHFGLDLVRMASIHTPLSICYRVGAGRSAG